MKVCPKCNTEHEKPGTFCSRKCANSRIFSEKTRKKKSLANIKHWNNLSEKEKEDKKAILAKIARYSTENHLNYILTEHWNDLGLQTKRLRVILEQKGKCNKCGISEWNGEIITLEFEHKDGNNKNNERDNVEALCPNCHSQTTTWRGRKNGVRQNRVKKYLDKI